MKRERRILLLGAISAFSAILFVLFFALPAAWHTPSAPDDFDGRLSWITRHPADWRVVSMVSDEALDSELPRRRSLWKRTFELAEYVAPRRVNPRSGFVRAGLFHWYELDAAERGRVLEVVAPLMKEQAFFDRMYPSFWSVTRDLAWLRRVAPETLPAKLALGRLAVRYGRFDDYRLLRDEIRRERLRQLAALPADAPVEQLLELIPEQLDRADEPLVRRTLAELDRRAFNPERVGGRLEPLVEYAVRHRVQPIAGLRPLIEVAGKLSDSTRALAALHLGDLPLATRVEISTAITGDPRWVPYYLDRARHEAQQGNETEAETYLARAAAGSMTPEVLAAAADVAAASGHPEAAAGYRRRLLTSADGPLAWSGTCGASELCSSATATAYFPEGRGISVTMSTAQSDETPPYVEILVDDELTAEGEVRDRRTFELPATKGPLHVVEVRLVNRLTRNGVQRRVRLS